MHRAELARCAAAVALAAGLLAGECAAARPAVDFPRVQSGAAQAAARETPDPADAPGRWSQTLAGLRLSDQRVADVAYRIVTANLDLCADVKPQTGLELQSALQYRPSLRPSVRSELHLSDRPTVYVVAAGSPAAGAGLREGDILLAVDGRMLAPPSPAPPGAEHRPASLAPVDAAAEAIESALVSGPARLRIQRGTDERDAVLTARPGCAYEAQVLIDPALKASADGRRVTISAGLVGWLRNDDMLAVLLGHEFAHDVLHHREQEERQGPAVALLRELDLSPATYRIEQEADYVGLYLTARAGYDITNAADVWRQLPEVLGQVSHPGHGERAASLEAARDEIFAKRRHGEPLTPNWTRPASPPR